MLSRIQEAEQAGLAGGLSLFQTRGCREGWALRGWERRVSGGRLLGGLAVVFVTQPYGADQ